MKITPIMLLIVAGVILYFFWTRKKISGSENGNVTMKHLIDTAETAQALNKGKTT